jgi:hypothetical protein
MAGVYLGRHHHVVKKHQTHLTDELERKIIALFTLGSSY